MKSGPLYPVCLAVAERLCIIIGGGRVAERKVCGLLPCKARIRLISPDCTAYLQQLGKEKQIDLRARAYRKGDLKGAFLIFAATDRVEVQQQVCQEARERDIALNIADAPKDCSFQIPSVHRQGDLILTVATGGKSPALAARIRRQLAREFGTEYAELLYLLGRVRARILAGDKQSGNNKILFQNLLNPDMIDWLREQRWDRIEQHLQTVLGSTIDISDFRQESQ